MRSHTPPDPDRSIWVSTEPQRWSLTPVLVALVSMAIIAVALVVAAWQGAFDWKNQGAPASRVTPAPYGYPCEVKNGTQRR